MERDLSRLDEWLAEAEAKVPGLKPGCAKRIDWPTEDRTRAPLAVLYIHGFSASGREVSPVPEQVAAAFDAPLFVTRLTGHGVDGAAMAAARVGDWRADVAEALEIGEMLGERVLIIACSTGATLVTEALVAGEVACDVVGVVYISPNFGLSRWYLQALLDAPGARKWAPWIVPRELKLDPRSAEHAAYWTLRYPPAAVFTADEAVKAARAADVGGIDVPAFWAVCREDSVAHPGWSRRMAGRWGGPVTHRDMVMGPGDDPMGHLVVGDIHSPSQVAPFVRDVLAWAGEVGIGPAGVRL